MKLQKPRKRKGKSFIPITNVQGKVITTTAVILVVKGEIFYVVINVQHRFIFSVSKLYLKCLGNGAYKYLNIGDPGHLYIKYYLNR